MDQIDPQAHRACFPFQEGLVGVIEGDDNPEDEGDPIDCLRGSCTIEGDEEEKWNDCENVKQA